MLTVLSPPWPVPYYKLFLDLVYAALRLGGCIKHCTHISVRLCRAWQVTKERKDLG